MSTIALIFRASAVALAIYCSALPSALAQHAKQRTGEAATAAPLEVEESFAENGQGANVAGGQHDYVINGNMIGDFALLAAPAQYDRSGIMTFVVNQAGTVYEKDLGPDTAALAERLTTFDPRRRMGCRQRSGAVT
jgi:hypothetical protein